MSGLSGQWQCDAGVQSSNYFCATCRSRVSVAAGGKVASGSDLITVVYETSGEVFSPVLWGACQHLCIRCWTELQNLLRVSEFDAKSLIEQSSDYSRQLWSSLRSFFGHERVSSVLSGKSLQLSVQGVEALVRASILAVGEGVLESTLASNKSCSSATEFQLTANHSELVTVAESLLSTSHYLLFAENSVVVMHAQVQGHGPQLLEIEAACETAEWTLPWLSSLLSPFLRSSQLFIGMSISWGSKWICNRTKLLLCARTMLK